MTDEEDEERDALSLRLTEEPGWQWHPGMLTLDGVRLQVGSEAPVDSLPDLTDWPTVGAILGILSSYGAFSDLIHSADGWIAAVEIDGDVTGYAADTPGEAAAWALLAVWENLPDEAGTA